VARGSAGARWRRAAIATLALGGLIAGGTAVSAAGESSPQQWPADPSLLESPGEEHSAQALAPRDGTAGANSKARGSKTFLRGFAESNFGSSDAGERAHWFGEAVRANAGIARLNLPWRIMTSGKPADATDPADPAYSFAALDRSVIDAAAHGQQILLTVYDAPKFAEGPDKSSEASPSGTWKPDPDDIADFAEAVATRYSGSFAGPGGVLPKVQYIEAWNESNLSDYLSPQYTKKSTFAGEHYRAMVAGFARGLKRAGSPAKLVAGAMAPYGDPQGGLRTRPLRFLRDFLCLDEDFGRRKNKACKGRVRFDILSHHPITLSGGPGRSAIHPDDAAMPDFDQVVKTLRAAERKNTIAGPNRHDAWATEFWWESNPPDGHQGVPLQKHARWIQDAQYSLWKQGASAAIWLLLVDVQAGQDGIAEQQSGIFFIDRREKPAFTAFRFPLALDRISKKRVNAWTIPPASGQLEIQEQRGGGFVTVETIAATDGKPVQLKLSARGKTKFRAMIGGETSLTAASG
jgi:hypothetical protein